MRFMRFFSLSTSAILAIAYLVATPLTAQSNTVWTLNPNIAHGRANSASYYSVTYSVHHMDFEGGHVQAHVTKPGKPECFAKFDYDWTFSQPLDVIRQDEIFEVKIELTASAGSDCPPPLDPLMSVTPTKGAFVITSLSGPLTNADKDLIRWHPKSPQSAGRIDVPTTEGRHETGDVFQFKVDDTRTSTGDNQNAERGAFKFSMGYRGAVYEAYYVFSAQ